MSSPAEHKTCGVCLRSSTTGQGQAIFTAECSHSFHFACIGTTFAYANSLCPVCHSKWNILPFTRPIFHNSPSHFSPFPTPPFPWPHFPLLDSEPLHFLDDEPLLDATSDPRSSALCVALQKVTIKAIPERPAVAASEPVSLFTVLVGLKAPSLSDGARSLSRVPVDLVTVLDVSGSMQGSKLAPPKHAVEFVIDNLGPSDRLSIVSFASQARRMLRLRRMTDNGREDAKRAVNLLLAKGGTIIVEGLKKGVRVLEERQGMNPVSSIIFLSDGNDTCHQAPFFQANTNSGQAPGYLHLLPVSICPGGTYYEGQKIETIPVHSFGFGSDHDPIAMHAISDASGGTFSFIESYEVVQDAFAGCIGGLLSVVAQELRLALRAASHGVEIRSIPSGRHANEIRNQGSQGLISVGDIYADEEKEFLINLSVPPLQDHDDQECDRKTSVLDIICSYRDAVSRDTVHVEGDLVEIRRPKSQSLSDMKVNLEVDRQRNRLSAAESIAEARQMAEAGNLTGARALLAKRRSDLLGSAFGLAGDGLCPWLATDMKETERRMENSQVYQQTGPAYALSGMSSHAFQRATTKGSAVAGAALVDSVCFGAATGGSITFGAYATPNMASMVFKSQQLSKTEGATTEEE